MVLSVKMALEQRSRGNEKNPTYSESFGADHDVGAAGAERTAKLCGRDDNSKYYGRGEQFCGDR